MYFLSKFQEYNIVINKYSHQAVHSILRTYSSHNWKCASFTQNLPIPPILCPWQPSVFSLFCYALESYSIISDSWGLPGKLRKNGANSSHSLITLYCSIFLAVLFYKVNIHWPLWKPLQTRRKVRNAHGGWAANRLGSSRPQSPLVMRAMAVTASGVTGDLSCISYVSWGHKASEILVSLLLWGSPVPLLPRYTTFLPSLKHTTCSGHICCLPERI